MNLAEPVVVHRMVIFGQFAGRTPGAERIGHNVQKHSKACSTRRCRSLLFAFNAIIPRLDRRKDQTPHLTEEDMRLRTTFVEPVS